MTIAWLGRGAVSRFDQPSAQGMSDTARRLDEVRNEVRPSASREAVLLELREAYLDAQEHNWDGENSSPAEPGSLFHANRLVQALSVSHLPDSIGVDPDGEMYLDWGSGYAAFSVGIFPDGNLSYAGLFGTNTMRGQETFLDDVPPQVMYGIRRALELQPIYG